MRRAWAVLGLVACVPSAEPVDPSKGESTVKVTKTDIDPSAPSAEPGTTIPAPPLDPPAAVVLSSPNGLVGGMAPDAPLPLPTTIAVTKSAVFAFGRSRGVYVLRTWSLKGKATAWGAPVTVVPAYDDDVPAVAASDGELVWFAASSKGGGVRVAKVSLVAGVPRVDEAKGATSKLGHVAAIVPFSAHIGLVGRDGDGVTFARLSRDAAFLDAQAKLLARGTPSKLTTASRSPRATSEDGHLLLAWDADQVDGALDTPGTTPTEKASPKPGVYVRRFSPSGESISPARRLTRPSFEAHALDVVVELGACAVLASTPDGFEMFRFVRKGLDLPPYGGGLHLAGAGGDVALSADVIGTIGLTTQKLLRIGPGVKIVPSNLGFAPPPGSSFEVARLASEGYFTWGLLGSRTPSGTLPLVVKVEGEHLGVPLPPPWIGPAPQQLLFAGVDGDEAIAIVAAEGGAQVLRLSTDGKVKSNSALTLDPGTTAALSWPRASVPRAARAGGEWLVALKDGRVLVATGPKAGALVSPPVPLGSGNLGPGVLGLVPNEGKGTVAHAFYLPHPERSTELAVAPIDPKAANVGAWTKLPTTEHHYGALGESRFAAVAKKGGGVAILGHAGTKVLSVAQIYFLVVLDADGRLVQLRPEAPGPLEEATLVPTPGGAALVASITGKGPSARWLDGDASWRDTYAYLPFRKAGDGPLLRAGGKTMLLPVRAAPLELPPEAAAIAARCAYALPTGPRSLLLVCEEGSGDSPLASRVTVRTLAF
ncbi:MAG: hypothetical protein IPJ34_17930 [Myxococcales bacterium]|nr:hypothetical protein [Myxococcales bacterium]